MNITYPDIPADEREQYAAAQPFIVYRLDGLCAVNVTGREVGADHTDGCGQPAVTRLDFYCYRSGFSTGGVFSPAETINVRVCAEHEPLFAGQPWLICSQPIEVAA
jgi:hypothetical protein